MEHPKDIGDRSTLAIMAALRDAGFALYVPFGENTRSDLILETDGQLARVQCKTGRLRGGAVLFKVCSSYAHHRSSAFRERSYHGEIDFFAVYCRETSGVYLIPIEDLPSQTLASLRVDPTRNNQQRRIRFAANYEVGRVAIEGLRGPAGAG